MLVVISFVTILKDRMLVIVILAISYLVIIQPVEVSLSQAAISFNNVIVYFRYKRM